MSVKFNFEAIGTAWQIDIPETISNDVAALLLHDIKTRIELFDKAYSRFRDDSLVMKISRSPGTYLMPEDFESMISLYHDLYIRTNGLVTPLIGQLISDAGYDKNYSLTQRSHLEPPPAWNDVMTYTPPSLITTKPILLDFGAAGKGYLIDIVARVIEAHRVHSYTIDAGGDILHKGNSSIRVGMENPDNFDQAIGVIDLQNTSVCGSAGNRRVWGNFNHIINPKQMKSPVHIKAVWVVAETALVADALATCLFFIAPENLLEKYNFQYVILNADFSIEKSALFPGELFQAI